MNLELRPEWCPSGEVVSQAIAFEDWKSIDCEGIADPRPIADLAGDDWQPGESLCLIRDVKLLQPLKSLRQAFGFKPGVSIGVAARWFCRATSRSGVHAHGPAPLGLVTETSEYRIQVLVPGAIAQQVELETCLVASWESGGVPVGVPDGALIWSDSWEVPRHSRTVQLEGSELRIPVIEVSFEARFGETSSALWSIDVDRSIDGEEPLANTVSVLLNIDELKRKFSPRGGEYNSALLPQSVIAGIQVDLVSNLTGALYDALKLEPSDWDELPDGSAGRMVAVWLIESFGSIAGALSDYDEDSAAFSRKLWSRFAPSSWTASL